LLEWTVQDLNERIQRGTVELIFNLAEAGLSVREDRETRTVLIPATMGSDTIHHGISRNIKHIWVIAHAFTAAWSLTPYVIAS
jgi:hypothetical protein